MTKTKKNLFVYFIFKNEKKKEKRNQIEIIENFK